MLLTEAVQNPLQRDDSREGENAARLPGAVAEEKFQ